MKEKLGSSVPWGLFIALLGFVAFLSWPSAQGQLLANPAVSLNIETAQFTSLVISLIAIALFIERSAEVYLSIWRRPGREQLAQKVRDRNKVVADVLKELENPAPPASMQSRLENARALVSEAKTELADYRSVLRAILYSSMCHLVS